MYNTLSVLQCTTYIVGVSPTRKETGMGLCVARLECVLGMRLCVASLECVLVLRYRGIGVYGAMPI